jgi:branched-chain amino acid aminotransferase
MIDWLIYNGETTPIQHAHTPFDNRAFAFGDGLFETVRMVRGKAAFWEDHYFRLMAGMRILRMEIPMEFTPEYFESMFAELLNAHGLDQADARMRLTVYRKTGGRTTPTRRDVDWVLTMERLPEEGYVLNDKGLTVDLFKDHFKPRGLLANYKTLQCLPYILGGIFAAENQLDDVLLLNDEKMLCEATTSNLFVRMGDELITPPLDSGCVRGIVRKQILGNAKAIGLQPVERSLTSFELLKADEVWLTNAINGIRWVGQYRTKAYGHAKADEMVRVLNTLVG